MDGAVEQDTPLSGTELLVLQDEVAHMERMTQTFLDFARPPKLIRQPVELIQVVDQCRELVRRRCETLGIQMTVHAEPITVMGDPQQLRQVILNLLLNAIDAQPDGGSIRLSIGETTATACASLRLPMRGQAFPMSISIASSIPLSVRKKQVWAWAWPSRGESSDLMGVSSRLDVPSRTTRNDLERLSELNYH